MKFKTSHTKRTRIGADPIRAGFTLAEVLAALLFMAIVIPVAVQGLRVATLAGEVADRKGRAARLAERLLNESLITTNWNRSFQSGTLVERDREYRWTLRSDNWSRNGSQYAPRQLTVEVVYPIQGRDYTLSLSTLTPHTQQ